jgi:site-specific DNA-cytosine methylase
MVLLLELFKGTGSFSKAAEELGFDVISVDIVEKYKPTILVNILEWDYKTIPVPDIITASPPCQTFSLFITCHKNKVRDYKGDMRPLNEKGELGDKILFKTLEIINYFLEKNPKLKFSIENPRGFMRKMECMNKEPIKYMDTTFYSMYGFNYRKPTNFWSNIEGGLQLKQLDKNLETKITSSIIKQKNIEERYKMPHQLCIEILTKLNMKTI